jgi:hypothetical protein
MLVNRHNINSLFIDSLNPLSVGNGDFIFTADITGLQTFPEFYSGGVPLGTISERGWHQGEKSENGNGFQTGQIGFRIFNVDGQEISINDIKNPFQKLSIWTGKLDSRFKIDGIPVHVETVCHPDYNLISVRVTSALLREKRLAIKISFPHVISSANRANHIDSEEQMPEILSDTNNLAIFANNKYNYIALVWRNDATIKEVTHFLYYLEPDKADSVYSFSCQFVNDPEKGRIQTFGETEAASKKSWNKFWNSVNVIKFNRSTGYKSRAIEHDKMLSLYFNNVWKHGSLRYRKQN